MKFACERCHTRYSIADEKIRQKILRIRCKACDNVITVQPHGVGAANTTGSSKGSLQKRRSTSARPVSVQEPNEWHLAIDGAQSGPMRLTEVAKKVLRLGASSETFVWKDGFSGWKEPRQVALLAAKITELRAAQAPPPPKAPPPPPPGTKGRLAASSLASSPSVSASASPVSAAQPGAGGSKKLGGVSLGSGAAAVPAPAKPADAPAAGLATVSAAAAAQTAAHAPLFGEPEEEATQITAFDASLLDLTPNVSAEFEAAESLTNEAVLEEAEAPSPSSAQAPSEEARPLHGEEALQGDAPPPGVSVAPAAKEPKAPQAGLPTASIEPALAAAPSVAPVPQSQPAQSELAVLGDVAPAPSAPPAPTASPPGASVIPEPAAAAASTAGPSVAPVASARAASGQAASSDAASAALGSAGATAAVQRPVAEAPTSPGQISISAADPLGKQSRRQDAQGASSTSQKRKGLLGVLGLVLVAGVVAAFLTIPGQPDSALTESESEPAGLESGESANPAQANDPGAAEAGEVTLQDEAEPEAAEDSEKAQKNIDKSDGPTVTENQKTKTVSISKKPGPNRKPRSATTAAGNRSERAVVTRTRSQASTEPGPVGSTEPSPLSASGRSGGTQPSSRSSSSSPSSFSPSTRERAVRTPLSERRASVYKRNRDPAGPTAAQQAKIRDVVGDPRNRLAVQSCYNRALRRTGSNTGGRLEVTVSVGSSGRVQNVDLDSSAGLKPVYPCIQKAVSRWNFPGGSEAYAASFTLLLSGT